MISITVNEQHLTAVATEPLVANSVNITPFSVTLDESWNDYAVSVTFAANGETREVLYTGGEMAVPWEVLQQPGRLMITVVGRRGDRVRPTSLMCPPLPIFYSGDIPSSQPAPSPDTAHQAFDIANNAMSTANDAAEISEYALLQSELAESYARQAFDSVPSVLTSESERVQREQERQTAESARIENEQHRTADETDRATAEQNRATYEAQRTIAEAERRAAEYARNAAELARQQAEADRNATQLEAVRTIENCERVTAAAQLVTAPFFINDIDSGRQYTASIQITGGKPVLIYDEFIPQEENA